MRKLHHLTLSPFCRKVRLVLAEKKLEVELIEESVWEKRLDFLRLSPSGKVPLLRDGKDVFSESTAISELLDESHPIPKLIPVDKKLRFEARRLNNWFDDKFHKEVGSLIIHEKIDRRFMNHEQGGGTPDMENVRIGLHNLKIHLEYICYLLSQRDWLAGQELSIADITAAAHLSCLDYTGDICLLYTSPSPRD